MENMEYGLNYQMHRGKKDLIFLHITFFLKKMCKFCLFLWTFDKKLHINALSLESVNRINALETIEDIFI